MKKLTLIIAICLAGLSCNKTLDLPSDGRLTTDQIFTNMELTAGYLNLCYSYMPYGGRLDDYTMSYDGTLLASFCDEAHDSKSNQVGAVQNWYAGNATISNFPLGDYWTPYYEGIRYCNIFLANADRVVEHNMLAQGDIMLSKAQVLVLRSFYLLQIIRRYGPAVIVTEPLDDVSDFSGWTRSSVKECADAIIGDCQKAIDEYGLEWFPGMTDSSVGMMSRATAYAIQSQAALLAASPLWNTGSATDQAGLWEWAAGITGTALNECLANGYALYTAAPTSASALASSRSAYQTYFFDNLYNFNRDKDKETIYQCRGRLSIWRDAGLPTNLATVRSGSCPTQEFVDAFEMVADGTSPFLMDDDGCILYTGVNPQPNPASSYNPANPYTGRDPRLTAIVFYNGALWNFNGSDSAVQIYQGGNCAVSATSERYTRTGYYLRKFSNNTSNASNPVDGYMKIFRLGELYLNFAEAANEAYGPGVNVPGVTGTIRNATAAVNVVRARAGMPDFSAAMTKIEFRKKYRNERRIELSFEQHRYYDVRRWNILHKTDKQLTGMNAVPINLGTDPQIFGYAAGRFALTPRQSYTEKYLLSPLPQAETSKMEFYTGIYWQNPMW